MNYSVDIVLNLSTAWAEIRSDWVHVAPCTVVFTSSVPQFLPIMWRNIWILKFENGIALHRFVKPWPEKKNRYLMHTFPAERKYRVSVYSDAAVILEVWAFLLSLIDRVSHFFVVGIQILSRQQLSRALFSNMVRSLFQQFKILMMPN